MGRDKNKQYYPLEQIKQFKDECRIKLDNFKFKTSIIVETRNGLHAYWLLNDNVTHEQFTECQNLLINHFNSDKAVKTVERIMRLPNYYWTKDINNKYMCKINLITDYTYNATDILTHMNNITQLNDNSKEGEKGVEDRISYKNTSLTSTPKPYKGDIAVQAIRNGDIELLQAIIKPIPKELENESQFYDYITQEIDLREFLGLPIGSFSCIFHDDNSPSAGIFITKSSQYFYKCHSSNCGFMGNIIRCVERLRRCNRPKAIQFIKEVYKLEIKETEWQLEQKKLLEENKRMIMSGEFEEAYPEIHKVVKNYLSVLNTLHDIAIDNVYDEKYSDDENNVVFFASINKISKALGMSVGAKGRLSDRIGLLAFLLLISKLKEEQIPENYLNKAKHFAAINKTDKQKTRSIVNFFSIPSYSDEHLLKTLERALMYQENNITMKGWSRELLQRTFGDELANEIYPYFQHRKVSEESTVRTEHIHKVTINLINTYGYAVEKDVLYNMVEMYSGMNKLYSKGQLHKQIKKSLQEMLDTYGWQRLRLNNKLKENYNVVCEGYPFIIVPQD